MINGFGPFPSNAYNKEDVDSNKLDDNEPINTSSEELTSNKTKVDSGSFKWPYTFEGV